MIKDIKSQRDNFEILWRGRYYYELFDIFTLFCSTDTALLNAKQKS